MLAVLKLRDDVVVFRYWGGVSTGDYQMRRGSHQAWSVGGHHVLSLLLKIMTQAPLRYLLLDFLMSMQPSTCVMLIVLVPTQL